MGFKLAFVGAFAAAGLVVLLFLKPIPQDPAYHAFADQRTILGLPHFWNVLSNLPLVVAGAAGLLLLARGRARAVAASERAGWTILMGALAAVGVGSAYYHAGPSDATLFWDRLPLTLMFSSLLALVFGERTRTAWGARLLGPLLSAGVGTLLYWRAAGDLRFYGYLQGLAMTALPLMLLLFPPRYTRTRDLWGVIALYVAAKAGETFDGPIYRLLGERLSGHTLKHLLAGAAAGLLVLHLARREAIKQPGPFMA